MIESAGKRPTCPQCLRAQSTCICRWITPIANQTEVLLLLHPLEVTQAKGSARLLHLCLARSELHIGEVFAADNLHELLHADGKTPVLLYPQNAIGTHPPLPFNNDYPNANIRLVVLDATWRKSRKMLHLNPLLQSLPRLSLQAMPASHYRIRKAHAPDQLSSLEATCYGLMQLEKNTEKFAPLLAAFDGFIAQMQQQWSNSHAENDAQKQ